MKTCPLARLIGVVHSRHYRDGTRCSCIGETEIVGDPLEIIGAQLAVVADDGIMARPHTALQCGLADKEDVLLA